MITSRAFSLIEVMAVTAIVGVAAGLGIAVSARTSQSIDDSQNETEILVLCTARDGGPCAAGGNELVAIGLRPAP